MHHLLKKQDLRWASPGRWHASALVLAVFVPLFTLGYEHPDLYVPSSGMVGFAIMLAFGGLLAYTLSYSLGKIHAASFRDPLTGLPNRNLLEHTLEGYFLRFQQHGELFHVLFVGVDNYNHLNSIFGHDVGDLALRQVGQRLQQVCKTSSLRRKPVQTFRFGGDSFIITIPYYLPEEQLATMVQHLLSETNLSYQVRDYQLEASLSIGFTTSGKSAQNARDLIRFADMAMHDAKNSPTRQAAYNDQVLSNWDRHFLIHLHLGKAIHTNELYPMCQPVYEVDTLKLIGCEILLRWKSGVLGNVPPDEFVPVAEASGLIHQIGIRVFQDALYALRRWKTLTDSLKVSINVSPYQLRDMQFYQLVHETFQAHPDLIPHVELEITESAPFINNEHMTQVLLGFKGLGLSIAMDDYGSGNTSFLNLQQGAFSRIKLDKRLVYEAAANETKRLVLKAAIDSARSLGVAITVEGVETREHLAMIRALGCSAVQGFLLSQPIALEAFTAMLQAPQREALQALLDGVQVPHISPIATDEAFGLTLPPPESR